MTGEGGVGSERSRGFLKATQQVAAPRLAPDRDTRERGSQVGRGGVGRRQNLGVGSREAVRHRQCCSDVTDSCARQDEPALGPVGVEPRPQLYAPGLPLPKWNFRFHTSTLRAKVSSSRAVQPEGPVCWLQTAEVHVKGVISVTPDSCTFWFRENH